MPDAKGYYSVIQYCPDPAKAEAVNVGVVLLCPARSYAGAKTRRDNDRVARMFGRGSFDPKRLNAAKKAITHRVEAMAGADLEDLQKFIATRANDLLLTPARSVRITDGDSDTALEELHDELVGHPATSERTIVIPQLDEAMRRPVFSGQVQFNQTVTVPVLGKKIRGLYAYQNGCLNLVKPQVFKNDPLETAATLANRGRLIHRHPDPQEGERKLIVVSEVKTPEPPDDLRKRITDLFDDFNTRVVWSEQIEAFAAEVEKEVQH